MAAPSGQFAAGRYLGVLVGILAVLYALVFFTGDSPTPKLGLDLEGGTTVTLQARTTDGNPPSREALDQARHAWAAVQGRHRSHPRPRRFGSRRHGTDRARRT